MTDNLYPQKSNCTFLFFLHIKNYTFLSPISLITSLCSIKSLSSSLSHTSNTHYNNKQSQSFPFPLKHQSSTINKNDEASPLLFRIPPSVFHHHYSPITRPIPKAPTKTCLYRTGSSSSKTISTHFTQSPSSDTSDSSNDDIIKILRKAKSFSVLIRLLKTTQIINQINSQLITTKSGGLTILAPDDGAFSQLKAGFLNSLEDNQKIELLQFHVFPIYVSSSNFDSLTNPVRTLAGDNPLRLQLNVTAYGNSVNISTGVVNATITGIVYSDKQLAIYHVDKVLLPLDFFQPKPPAPALALAKAPKADKDESSEAEVQTTKHNSGAVSLIGVQGTTLASLGIALFTVPTI